MAEDLKVNESCSIPQREIETRFTTSGGPGGQHANRAHTRVEVRFSVAASESLSYRQRQRLLQKLGDVVEAGAEDNRSQTRNRELALERLAEKLAAALFVPKSRRKTKPSHGSKKRRLKAKSIRSETKRQRSRPKSDDW